MITYKEWSDSRARKENEQLAYIEKLCDEAIAQSSGFPFQVVIAANPPAACPAIVIEKVIGSARY